MTKIIRSCPIRHASGGSGDKQVNDDTPIFKAARGDTMERYDALNGYCRLLGHYLPFRYCRNQQNGLPCAKIADCYFEIFPIREFIADHYSIEEQALIFRAQPPKLHSIIDLIAKARQRVSEQ